MKKALVVGFFSTFGDLEVLYVVKNWLTEAGLEFDISSYSKVVNNEIHGSKNIYEIDPLQYTHLIIVCGPFWRDYFKNNKIDFFRFSHCNIIGINLSMIESKNKFNPFNTLFPRDANGVGIPDLSLLYDTKEQPVIGLCLAPNQPEYGDRQNHDYINNLIIKTIAVQKYGIVNINTQWPLERNESLNYDPDGFESVCKRIDVLITTRLHGLVLGLKAGTPVIAIDPIIGGDKVSAQGRALGWPIVFLSEDISAENLAEMIFRCLSGEYNGLPEKVFYMAKNKLSNLKDKFIHALEFPENQTVQDLFPQFEIDVSSNIRNNSPSQKFPNIRIKLLIQQIRSLIAKH
jgi:hypothetical protein